MDALSLGLSLSCMTTCHMASMNLSTAVKLGDRTYLSYLRFPLDE